MTEVELKALKKKGKGSGTPLPDTSTSQAGAGDRHTHSSLHSSSHISGPLQTRVQPTLTNSRKASKRRRLPIKEHFNII